MKSKKYKLVFFGTPDFAVPTLRLLAQSDLVEKILVVTQNDKPVGRGQKEFHSSPIKLLAEKLNLPLIDDLKTGRKTIVDFQPDLAVVSAYGKILPQRILDLFPYGCLNIHPSLLPKYRGPSPIQNAILNGDERTGVSIIKLDQEMDHGPIIAQTSIPLTGTENEPFLTSKLAEIGSKLLLEALPDYLADNSRGCPQNDDLASFTALIKKEDGILNFNDSAIINDRKIRAYFPWPAGQTEFIKNGQPLSIKILRAKAIAEKPVPTNGQWLVNQSRLLITCETGSLLIHELQPAGKKPMPASAFINGYLK